MGGTPVEEDRQEDSLVVEVGSQLVDKHLPCEGVDKQRLDLP